MNYIHHSLHVGMSALRHQAKLPRAFQELCWLSCRTRSRMRVEVEGPDADGDESGGRKHL